MRYANFVRKADLKAGFQFGLKVVGVVGGDDDWAAYEGPLEWPDERVAAEGDKLTQKAAEGLFPVLVQAGLHYRR